MVDFLSGNSNYAGKSYYILSLFHLDYDVNDTSKLSFCEKVKKACQVNTWMKLK